MIKKDYVIEASVDCDPYSEACFVWECDPESDVEGESCTGDPEEDIWYFKIARRNASRIPLCDPNTDENCQPFLCDDPSDAEAGGEEECEEELCTEENMEGYYATSCNDPVAFTEENPIEEEDAEEEIGEDVICEESDEECLLEEKFAGDEAVEDEAVCEGNECIEDVEVSEDETETE